MRKILLILSCVLTLPFLAQQDPQYSQYQFNQMVINPAYAGTKDALSAVIDIRKQWSGFDGAPSTQSFSFHAPLKKKRIGLGLSAYNDAIGPKRVTAAYGNVSYILPLSSKLKLSFGLRAGIVNYVYDFNKMNYKDPGETNAVAAIGTNKLKPDFDAGLFLKSNSFFAGISATHLNSAYVYNDNVAYTNATGSQVEYDLTYKLKTHVFGIVSKGFAAGENLVINPTVIVKLSSGVANIDANLNFLLKQRIWLGVFTRSSGTVGALVQVIVTNNIKIGYSFDATLGKVQKRLGNGHEIMIGFDLNTFKSKMLSPRYL
ncbi:MAG: type IX secretion system membrane protein PorP/SprF [Bacteroidia bacterium]|jgi:type IX secretion system PorP/SprF family membrane protein|nr:type IX secretion system membrane protein PorP/SprF [Bacteroidia bacterium]